MANLPENPIWEPGIRQLELTDPVQGGPDGADNMAPKQLASRTAYLKQEVELRATIASPAFTGNPTAPTQAPGNNSQRLANTAFVQAALAALVDSSPAALDTLNELAAALGDDPAFATTVMNALAGKADISQIVQTGTIAFFAGDTPPTGWLKVNGALLSRASYPDLWGFAQYSGMFVTDATWLGGYYGSFSSGDDTTTFRLPDARGEFLRALDDGRGIDSGRTLGSNQSDQNKNHVHGESGGGSLLTARSGSSQISTNSGSFSFPFASNTASSGGNEARPRNLAYLPIIKD